MKVACILAIHLPVQVEQHSNPSLVEHPLILGGRPWDSGVVLDCCSEAAATGVHPGMHLAQAETLCPTARFLPSREEAYRIAHQALVAAAGRFTPIVETAGLGFVYAQVSGLERIAGSDTELARRLSIDTYSTSGLLAQVGVAGNKFTAEQAALAARPGNECIVSPGEERSFLSPLPLYTLPADPEMCHRLAKLGINTLGAFAALPRTAIVHQFGPYAGPLYDLACGVDPRPVQPEAPPLVVERRRVFDDPLFDVQPLLAHAHQMAAELGEELSHQGYQAEGVRLQLKAGSKVYAAGVPVKPPSADPEKLGRLAGRLLDQWLSAEPDRTLSSPLTNSQIEVDALTLSSYPLRPAYLAITQPGLFAREQQSHEQLREVLRGLRARFGELVIVKASLIGPPPSRPVEVTTGPDGLPRALVWRDQIHRVAAVYESWRERRCWWGRPVERDYFRLEISNLARPTDDAGGRQVRVVFRDLRADQWLLEQRRI